MRKLWPLLILLLPGCTFFSVTNNGPGPRPASELKEVSPAIYIVLALFAVILVVSVFAAIFKEQQSQSPVRDDKGVAMMMALFAALVVMLLVG